MEGRKHLSGGAAEAICERLCLREDLYFPNAINRQNTLADPANRRELLLDLLSTDAAVFLERYGSHLEHEELIEFDFLRDDYEINWHLKHLRSAMNPTTEEKHLRHVTVKNRRRAFLDKLIHDGQYFSEDAMREREPFLHHEYVGKFQDPIGRCMSRPGERWSETLMRRCEEDIISAEIRKEQERLGVPMDEWIGCQGEDEEEEEEEEEDTNEREESDQETEVDGVTVSSSGVKVETNGTACSGSALTEKQHQEQAISALEIQDRMEQFTYIMQQKFLSGGDMHLDYSKIDDDEALDDHWTKEVTCDAEEKYFAED